MSNQVTALLNRVRKPEYTGENRCVPCTAVNVAIALLASALVALVAFPLAVVVFFCSIAVIYLRGYLVPGTPALTERYLPEHVLAAFDTHPIEETRNDDEAWETVEEFDQRQANAVDPEQFLSEVGAVGPCEHEDDLCLTDEFATLVDDHIADIEDPTDRETLADLFDSEPDAITVLEREYPAIEINRRVRKWPSEAALLADVADDDALEALTDRWNDVPLAQRLGILQSLRSFHATCPRCGSEIVLSDGTVESCCRTHEVLSLGCRDCGQPLLEFSPEALGLRETETGIQP